MVETDDCNSFPVVTFEVLAVDVVCVDEAAVVLMKLLHHCKLVVELV